MKKAPNILPIYSFGQEAGLTYIAMRYVEAGTLKEMLGRPLDLKTAADILGQIGRALDYAHRQGIVHRDVKPTNVLMAEGKWALLTDFGLARMVESSVQLTKTGVGVGTPAYMSPEQGQGIRVDARSDVYSLGVVLYEMATGKVPYEAETPMAVVLKHITAPLPLPREVNPVLPEVVERVILKAMAKAPEDRYQTAGELVEALQRAAAEEPVVERPPEAKPVPVEKAPSTVVAELTPAPVAAVPVEAPPVTRKGLTELPQMGNDVRPAWSPDGKWLAFHSNGNLAIMRPDGSDPAVIWDSKGRECTFDPQWSPDSRWIAVSMQIGGCEWTFPMTREVWVISRDGATRNTVATFTHENGECLWPEVAFSPDGKQVAYNDANCKPWIINANGSGQAMPLEGFP